MHEKYRLVCSHRALPDAFSIVANAKPLALFIPAHHQTRWTLFVR
jgi:hypothetical protein